APSFANNLQVSAPWPDAPPVTITILFLKRIFSFSVVRAFGTLAARLSGPPAWSVWVVLRRVFAVPHAPMIDGLSAARSAPEHHTRRGPVCRIVREAISLGPNRRRRGSNRRPVAVHPSMQR